MNTYYLSDWYLAIRVHGFDARGSKLDLSPQGDEGGSARCGRPYNTLIGRESAGTSYTVNLAVKKYNTPKFTAQAWPPCRISSASTSALAQEVDQRHASKPQSCKRLLNNRFV
jgi:hypothetical protein